MRELAQRDDFVKDNFLSNELRVPITLLGMSLPEDGYHGPNESYAWSQARGGMLTFVRYFERLAALHARG